MNANLKLQVVGLTNRAGILIGAADMIEQFTQVTAALVQENEALVQQNVDLQKKMVELNAQLLAVSKSVEPAKTP